MKIPDPSPEQPDIDEILSTILRNAVRALKGSAGVVATWNEPEHRFVSCASSGLGTIDLKQLRDLLDRIAPGFPFSQEILGRLSSKLPEDYLPFSEEGVRQDPIIALPLKSEDSPQGLIFVLRPEQEDMFSGIDTPVLSAFAEQAEIALHNADLARKLAEEKARVEAILENSAEGIMSINSECRIIGFNAAMEKLTGYSREEAAGMVCGGILGLDKEEQEKLCSLRCPLHLPEGKPQQIYEYESTIHARGGRKIPVAMTFSVVHGQDGHALNAVVNIRDVSRQRETENLRDAILSMLGHELQTPLSIIKGYTSTLLRTDGNWDNHTIKQGLQVIEEESDRLSSVMSKLLLASRLSAGKVKLEREPVQLSGLAGKVVRRLEGLNSKHTLIKDFQADFPSLTAVPQLMEQVISNLVENAIKYSPEGGKVLIKGRYDRNSVEVSVTDEGIGIPSGEIENLFQKFYRVQSGSSRKIEGTGLGLYICKAIVEAHGGKLEVSSQQGKGSTFTFRLPLEHRTDN